MHRKGRTLFAMYMIGTPYLRLNNAQKKFSRQLKRTQVMDGRGRDITRTVGAGAGAGAGPGAEAEAEAGVAVNVATVATVAAAAATGVIGRAILMMSLHFLMKTTPAPLPVHLVDRVTVDTIRRAHTTVIIAHIVVVLHNRIGSRHASALDDTNGNSQARAKTVAKK